MTGAAPAACADIVPRAELFEAVPGQVQLSGSEPIWGPSRLASRALRAGLRAGSFRRRKMGEKLS